MIWNYCGNFESVGFENPTYHFSGGATLLNTPKVRSKPKESPCVNCKIRSTSPPKAVICIRNGRCWWWNRSERRSHSCRCLSGIFSVSGICWHRRFAGVLRRAQYRVSEQNPVPIARNIIAAKIQASKRVLQRQIRNYG